MSEVGVVVIFLPVDRVDSFCGKKKIICLKQIIIRMTLNAAFVREVLQPDRVLVNTRVSLAVRGKLWKVDADLQLGAAHGKELV